MIIGCGFSEGTPLWINISRVKSDPAPAHFCIIRHDYALACPLCEIMHIAVATSMMNNQHPLTESGLTKLFDT